METKKAQNRDKFYTEVLNVLQKDVTQTCNDAPGTDIKLQGSSIVILAGISAATLSRLINTGYLVDCTEEGRLRINQIKLG